LLFLGTEELDQDRYEYVVGHAVVLAGQDAAPTARYGLCQRRRARAGPVRARSAGQDQGGYADRGHPLTRHHVVVAHAQVVRERMGEGGHEVPARPSRHPGDVFNGHSDRLDQKTFPRPAAQAGRDQRGELIGEVGRRSPAAIADVRRLVDGQPRHRYAGGRGLEGQGGPRGVTEHEHAAADPLDERGQVIDLALDRVRCRVGTRTAAAPVVGVHRERRGKGGGQ
jgi:hypothetical protein